MKIGVIFGNPETTPGGLALKFYSSVRIELRKSALIKYGDEIIGSGIRAKIVKNKVAAPFRTAEFIIYYNEGISYEADLLNAAEKAGIVKRAGSWYQYDQKRLGQGLEGARAYLKENPEVSKAIRAELFGGSRKES